MQTASESAEVEAMGCVLGPHVLQAVHALYADEQNRLAAGAPAPATDLAYGPAPRQRLDLYPPRSISRAVPIVLWVHGGGFVRGDKRAPEHPFNAHVGRWASRHGFLGAVMNYRLAPEHAWPAGAEDVGAALDWLRANRALHGGDPDRVVLAGASAGAVHVATHIARRPDAPGVAGAVLLSGLYGFTPLEPQDELYFGAPELYPARRPREAMIAARLPILLASAEFDPPRFQREFCALLAARLERHGRLPRAYVGSGHNHFSLACHLGGADTRLSDEILSFIEGVASPPTGTPC